MSKFPASPRSPMAAAVAIAADESILGVYIENLGRQIERKTIIFLLSLPKIFGTAEENGL